MLIRAGLVLIMILPVPALAGSGLPSVTCPGVLFICAISIRRSFRTFAMPDRIILSAGRSRATSPPSASSAHRPPMPLQRCRGMLAEKKLSLIVWDCYRPKRAVDDFLQWSRDPAHSEMKAEFYPRTDKQKLFALGYLATRSAHSRGSTVDLGIVPPIFQPPPPPDPSQPPQGLHFAKRREVRGWNDRFRHRLRLSGRAWKYVKRFGRRGRAPQPSNIEILHGKSGLSSLCPGVVALRTRSMSHSIVRGSTLRSRPRHHRPKSQAR